MKDIDRLKQIWDQHKQLVVQVNGRIHISRPCELHFAKCDNCSLQAECTELFDYNGKACQDIGYDYIWMQIEESSIDEILELRKPHKEEEK